MHIRKRLTVVVIGIAATLFLSGILADFSVTYDKIQAINNYGSDSFDLGPGSERSRSFVTDENNSELTITLRSDHELQFYVEFHENTGWENEYSKYNISQLDSHFLLRQPGEWLVQLRNNSTDQTLRVSYSMNITTFYTEAKKPYYWIRNPAFLSGSLALFLIVPINFYEAIKKKWNRTATEILVFSIMAILVLGSGPILGALLGARSPFACPTTPSMEPAIWPGDLVIIGGSNPKDLTDGDIIAYDMIALSLTNPTAEKMSVPILHRIAGIIAQNNTRYFITKGDNNPASDDWYVPEEGVIGKAIYIIPFLGNIVITLSRFEVKIAIIALTIVIVVLYPNKKTKPNEEKK
jgi:signal peptidase